MKVSARISQLAPTAILALLAAVLVTPLLLAPDLGQSRATRVILLEMLAMALLGFGLLQSVVPKSGARLLEFLRRGANLPVLLLVLYGLASSLWSSAPAFSRAEWLRLACGAAIYFVVASFQRREHVQRIVDALTAVAILTSLFGIAGYGETDPFRLTYPFGNRQLLAGFLLVLAPLMVGLAFSDLELKRKLAAQAAAALSLTALLLTQTRSAWVGMLVALTALGVLALLQGSPSSRFSLNKHQLVVPAIALAGGLGLFLVLTQTGPVVQARASTIASAVRDPSFAWRLERWQGAWKLLRARPLFGWGIGTFPLEQSRTVPNAPPRSTVEHVGPSLYEQAHNEYAQMAAELGLIGLGLYLWALGTFFRYGGRALRGSKPGLRQLVLMGCLAAVAGQAVDALSNPAWRFADVSFLFWLMLGLGVAAAHSLQHAPSPAETRASLLPTPGPARLGWQGGVLIFTVLMMGSAWAAQLPVAAPAPSYLFCDPISAIEAITSSGPPTMPAPAGTSQIHINVGQCVTLGLKVQFRGTNTYTDVTSDPNTTFFTAPPMGLFTSKNVFCATAALRNKEFPVYGRYCCPVSGICATATVHVHVNR